MTFQNVQNSCNTLSIGQSSNKYSDTVENIFYNHCIFKNLFPNLVTSVDL